MNEKNLLKIINILTDKITSLETDLIIKDIEIDNLKSENARLNELLTPTAKGDN